MAATMASTLVALLAQRLAVRDQLAGLESVTVALAAHADRALLLGIEAGTTGQDGRVVIALGDPDQARHTAVFVPGINTDLRDTPGGVDAMERLRVMADATTSAPRDVSVVYWLGYDAPQTQDALSYDGSRDGGHRLTPFIAGLHAAHDAVPSHVTLVGHSYGSTVVAEAALHGLHVDDIIAAGSPGMHTDRAEHLGLDPRHVWSGLATDDPIGGWLGDLPLVHGEEPTDPAFGANQFVVDTHGHSGYWTPNSTSLRNQAAIVVGRYDLVRLVHGSPPTA
jgi:pimeloyl-ACP methyl ester carboxylesterase